MSDYLIIIKIGFFFVVKIIANHNIIKCVSIKKKKTTKTARLIIYKFKNYKHCVKR